MANSTPASKLQANAEYHEKSFRKSVVFRPNDKALYLRLCEEKGNMSPLVRELLKNHFDKVDSKRHNEA